MKVMRFATNRARRRFSLESISSKLRETLPYNIRPKHEVEAKKIFDLNAMIPQCFMKQFEGEYEFYKKLECELFQPAITDMGICPSFNGKQMSEMFEPSYFLTSFLEAYKEDLNNMSSVKYGEELGQSLKFYLFNTPKEMKYEMTADTPTTFNLAVTASKEFFGMKGSSFKIKAGYKSIIEVEPMEIVASEDLKTVPLAKRKCKFDDEIDGIKLFKTYSQSGCEFEMNIRKGLKKCKCVPWFIPTNLGQNYTMCDKYGNRCFEFATMGSGSFENCLPNCNLAQFSRSLILEKIDPHEVCTSKTSLWASMTGRLFSGKGLYLLFKTQKLKQWLYSNTNESYVDEKAAQLKFCEHMAKYYMAEVTVKFANKKYIRTRMDVKVSFSDQLGVFGDL